MNGVFPRFSRFRGRRILARFGAAALSVGILASPLAFAAPVDGATKQIQHVVFLMQENHTFDNYFSAFPGVEQPQGPACQPNWIPTPIPVAKPSPSPTASPSPGASPTASPTPSSTPRPTPALRP